MRIENLDRSLREAIWRKDAAEVRHLASARVEMTAPPQFKRIFRILESGRKAGAPGGVGMKFVAHAGAATTAKQATEKE